ncbi:hypothetical protein DENSPDRAFT_928957 [Dentipellis sp. KUC8613]|nr:hypothetical protein DENSPDRAFT_928957 [Dentipellis sp. KUC8613]
MVEISHGLDQGKDGQHLAPPPNTVIGHTAPSQVERAAPASYVATDTSRNRLPTPHAPPAPAPPTTP